MANQAPRIHRHRSEPPSVRQSAWDTFDSDAGLDTPGTTGVHGGSSVPHPGVRINQYEIIRLIGEGGMGSVFLARDLRLGRRVAIKFLQSDQPELTQRFLVEARTTARCQHDNIVVIYEVGEHDGAPYIVLEYLSGKPLTYQTEHGQKLPYTRAVEIMCSVLRALQCAHQHGIVHRDLKPDNIFVTEAGTIKVLDFSIAKVMQQSQQAAADNASGQPRMPSPLEIATGTNNSLTRVGTIMGTLKYMSPEQWGIGIEIDHLTDIWACGILLHRLICGRHPLHPLDGNQLVVTAMLELPMPSMAEAAPADVPRELIQVVDRCLLKAKELRWQSAADLLSALEPFGFSRRVLPIGLPEAPVALPIGPSPAPSFEPPALNARPGPSTRTGTSRPSHSEPSRPDSDAQHLRGASDCPYPGLLSFQDSDTKRFFARSHKVAEFVRQIHDNSLVTLIGSSGVGKTSFIRAGLAPVLKASDDRWETLIIRPGGTPLQALASIEPMLATTTKLAVDIDKQMQHVDALRREPGYLADVLRWYADRNNCRVLLVVDQAEELYTEGRDASERSAFMECLATACLDAVGPLRVLLSIRSGFIDRLAEDLQCTRELVQGLFFLDPPTREGMRDAILRPAELAGFRFEQETIVEDMLDQCERTPGSLPVLQLACVRLWANRDLTRRMLTHRAYEDMGGIAGVLASHADQIVAELGPSAAALAQTLLLRLITADRTRAVVSRRDLRVLSPKGEEINWLIDQLVDARLLVAQALRGSKDSTIEIVHDSLLHRWPTLQRWLGEDQADATLIDHLRTAARIWQQKNYDEGLLWRGKFAAEAMAFRARYKGPLSDTEDGFLNAVAKLQAKTERQWWKRLFLPLLLALWPRWTDKPSGPLARGSQKLTVKTRDFTLQIDLDEQGGIKASTEDKHISPTRDDSSEGEGVVVDLTDPAAVPRGATIRLVQRTMPAASNVAPPITLQADIMEGRFQPRSARLDVHETDESAREFISDFKRNADELRSVAAQMRANRLIPFVGAGLSIPCGYPGWSAFLASEARACGLGDEIQGDIATGNFEMAAERLSNKLEDFSFDRRIQHVYGAAQDPRGAVLLLPRIVTNSLVTTNFDDVIERVFVSQRRQLSTVAGARFASFSHAIFGTRPHLLKLHGDAHDWSNRVLTYSEYQRHYGDGPPWSMDLPIALSRLVSSVSLLFLGCSLSTDRTIAILGQVALLPAAPTHFAIVEAPADPAACDERQRELGRHRIAPIWYPSGQHHWVSVLLEIIAQDAGR